MCVVVECSSDIKICSNRLEPVDGVPISACGNLAYLQHYSRLPGGQIEVSNLKYLLSTKNLIDDRKKNWAIKSRYLNPYLKHTRGIATNEQK